MILWCSNSEQSYIEDGQKPDPKFQNACTHTLTWEMSWPFKMSLSSRDNFWSYPLPTERNWWPWYTAHISESKGVYAEPVIPSIGLAWQPSYENTKCYVCLAHRTGQAKEPLLQHESVARPWSKVAADLCEFDNHTLLIISDYYSNYIEVARLNAPTSRSVIKEMKAVFAR